VFVVSVLLGWVGFRAVGFGPLKNEPLEITPLQKCTSDLGRCVSTFLCVNIRVDAIFAPETMAKQGLGQKEADRLSIDFKFGRLGLVDLQF
jgi:hypothetical protein